MKLFVGLTAVWLCLGLLELQCAAKPTDKMISTSAKESDSGEDDSDMLMEPDEVSHVSVLKSQSHQIYPQERQFEVTSQPGVDLHPQAAQNFYPPFFREAQPLGHSRPYLPDEAVQPKFSGQNPRAFDQTILGSGDFGVIRGGTFYAEDETPYTSDESSEFNQFYGDNANNGHGRPQAEAYVQKYTYPEEQFANFRDFADINTPTDSAFSQFVVVYAAKNSTSANRHHPNPKNIFEQLQLLDKEKATAEEKKNRISKSKSKLESTKLERKYKKKTGPKDWDYEPLLALS